MTLLADRCGPTIVTGSYRVKVLGLCDSLMLGFLQEEYTTSIGRYTGMCPQHLLLELIWTVLATALFWMLPRCISVLDFGIFWVLLKVLEPGKGPGRPLCNKVRSKSWSLRRPLRGQRPTSLLQARQRSLANLA